MCLLRSDLEQKKETRHAPRREAGCRLRELAGALQLYRCRAKKVHAKDAYRNELVPMRLHAEMLTDPSEAGDACVTLLLRTVGYVLFNTTRAHATWYCPEQRSLGTRRRIP